MDALNNHLNPNLINHDQFIVDHPTEHAQLGQLHQLTQNVGAQLQGIALQIEAQPEHGELHDALVQHAATIHANYQALQNSAFHNFAQHRTTIINGLNAAHAALHHGLQEIGEGAELLPVATLVGHQHLPITHMPIAIAIPDTDSDSNGSMHVNINSDPPSDSDNEI